MKRHTASAALLLLACLLGAPAHAADPSPAQDAAPAPAPAAAVVATPSTVAAPSTVAPATVTNVPTSGSSPAIENQVLSQMDKLSYRILEDPSKGVAETMAVTALLELHFPISRGAAELVTINVKDKTLAQVRQELKAVLDAEYYRNATIELKLLDRSQKGGQVFFIGQVRSYSVPLIPGEPKTLLEGVLQAGTTEWANLKKVELRRINAVTQKPELKIIDVEAIKNGDRNSDILLQDRDRINIPEVKFKVF